ncbi:class I SAM-dependent methyltransferase [Anianabacter salinae]|uniref:class I SAM-dependent methyltransferase n=1 Tax=Anianabacter salinae TaxID=2851023 RepID=UPI00225DDD70|nr:class I SAM-dependent methyltransferase [Anianabacter salinae]MBV0914180.1 class I SAM-dependent methyltransferase [Anianabacter salinae]
MTAADPITCPVCAGQTYEVLGPYRSTTVSLGNRDKVECSACGMVFAAPVPDEALWDAYNADYFQEAHGGATEAPQAILFRKAIAHVRYAFVKQAATQMGLELKAVLEVGAGHGEFMEDALRDTPGLSYTVIDTDKSALAALKAKGGQPVTDFGVVPATSQDLVVLSHVLEHTRDPVGFLRACSKTLRAGGIVYVDVPCLDYLYKDIDEPHLLFFDRPSLENALSNAGLSLQDIGYFGALHADIRTEIRRPRALRLARRLGSLATSWSLPQMPLAERAVIAGFAAQKRQEGPARWLRAIARK